MEKHAWAAGAQETLSALSKGAFLTTAGPGKINTMTIGWGNLGYIWGRPVFLTLVRPSRFTHQLLEAGGEFTVTIPQEDMKEALALCGSMSGREGDKLAAAGLCVLPSRQIAVPRLACPGRHYECRVVDSCQMDPSRLARDIQGTFYPEGDYHTLYFGEIIEVYQT